MDNCLYAHKKKNRELRNLKIQKNDKKYKCNIGKCPCEKW